MKKVLTLTLSLLLLCSFAAQAQNTKSTSSTKSTADSNRKRGPIFRATKGQINQAQSILKERGFYGGDQTGKLDDATREGLRKYQQAEGLKTTGTLNKATLEKMGVALTDRQKTM
ncbi:MAG TPA: peptidoglycan-binding domain-containing protein [Pyrinomonadaceae bacterium]